jgi:hypothetical protein
MPDPKVKPLVQPEQHAGSFAGSSTARRGWTLFVACAGVSLVIASMIALNTALSDIAAATSATQTQLAWVVDSYIHARFGVPAAAGGGNR